MWWLILCVNLTRLRDALVAGKTLFPGMFVRVLQEQISIWIGKLSKADGPPQHGCTSSNPLRARLEQKGRRRVNLLSLSLCLIQDLYLVLPLDISAPGSQLLDSDLDLTPLNPQFLGPWTQTALYHCLSWSSSLHAADHGTCWPP